MKIKFHKDKYATPYYAFGIIFRVFNKKYFKENIFGITISICRIRFIIAIVK